jgi:hypothetical protein
VARRITTAAAGFTAFASLLLPGPTSTITSATAAPLGAAPTDITIGPEHPVAEPGAGSYSQRRFDVASDGQNSFVVWRNATGDAGNRIYGRRIGPDGEILDGTGIDISAGPDVPDAANAAAPAVAFDGTNYLVVWSEWDGNGTRIGGARVSLAGQVLDRFEVAGSNWESLESPAVAFGGGVFLVAWHQSDGGVEHEIRATRVSPAGTVVDPQVLEVDSRGPYDSVLYPAIASDGNDFQVVWTQIENIVPVHVHGTRVSATGAVQRPSTAIATTEGIIHERAGIAWQNGTYLVVWTTESESGFDVYGTRLNSAGAVVDPAGIAIATRPSNETEPSVGGNGGSFFVAWNDRRKGDSQYGPATLTGTRVGSDGTVESPDGRVIGNTDDLSVVASASGPGRFTVTYSRDAPVPRAADQAYLRHIAPK